MTDLPQTDKLTYEGDLRRVVREELKTHLNSVPNRDEVRRMIQAERERIEERSRAEMDEQMTTLRGDLRGELTDLRTAIRELGFSADMVKTLNTSMQSLQRGVANVEGQLDGLKESLDARRDQVNEQGSRIAKVEDDVDRLDGWHGDVDQRFSLLTNFIYGGEEQPGLSQMFGDVVGNLSGFKMQHASEMSDLKGQVHPLAEWINAEKERREARREFYRNLWKTSRTIAASNPGKVAAILSSITLGGLGGLQIVEIISTFVHYLGG